MFERDLIYHGIVDVARKKTVGSGESLTDLSALTLQMHHKNDFDHEIH
jgi:hypothetical protein